MRIGVLVEAATVDEAVAGVRAAADLGFRGAWFANIFGLDAITAAALAGREVPVITVGTAVVPTFPRHPFAMAQQVATAVDATGGRFVLGIGLSHEVVIRDLLGLSYERPAGHMREYLSVLLPLLREGRVEFAGERYAVNAHLDRPPGEVPVLVAALGPAMLRLAGELADGTVTWMAGERTLADHIVPSITAAAAAAGRPAPRVAAGLPVCVTADPDAARERAARVFSVYGQLPVYRAVLDREGATGPADVAVVGDESTVASAVHRLAEDGVTDFEAAIFGTAEERQHTREVLAGVSAAS